MKEKIKNIFRLPSVVLFILWITDIIRWIMHTFILQWSGTNIAKLPLLPMPNDQLFLLGIFGISNFLTGLIYLLISKKAKELSPYILILIPLAYTLWLIGISTSGVIASSSFYGKYFMFVYFGICIITFINFLIQKRESKQHLD